jgi:protein tyrosine/serine phosphatase
MTVRWYDQFISGCLVRKSYLLSPQPRESNFDFKGKFKCKKIVKVSKINVRKALLCWYENEDQIKLHMIAEATMKYRQPDQKIEKIQIEVHNMIHGIT